LALLVHDQNRLDWIHRPQVMPFIIASRDHHFVATAMVAFDKPAPHQNGMAVGVANCLGIAANRLGEQTTRTTVAVTAMLVVVHKSEAPMGAPRSSVTCRPADEGDDSCPWSDPVSCPLLPAPSAARRSFLPCGNAASWPCRPALLLPEFGRPLMYLYPRRLARLSTVQQTCCEDGFQFHGYFSKSKCGMNLVRPSKSDNTKSALA
jgi:hypothetical protein